MRDLHSSRHTAVAARARRHGRTATVTGTQGVHRLYPQQTVLPAAQDTEPQLPMRGEWIVCSGGDEKADSKARRGQYSDAVLSSLESQNDAEVEGITAKVKILKGVSKLFSIVFFLFFSFRFVF